MAPTSTLNANGVEIGVIGEVIGEIAYLCLTDIARYKNPDEPKAVVANWMRLRSTIEFLGLWEQIHNPDFKGLEFDAFKNEAGNNAFTLSPQKWISSTNAIGLVSKSGRYGGGTYAHADIAFEFASWVSPEFKLYIIKDYQRLKKDEADMLNVALFGKNAREWRNEHPVEAQKGENIRDYASAEELIILVNMESQNAELIKEGLSQSERFAKLHEMTRTQMQILLKNRIKEKLKNINPNLLKGTTE